MFLSLDCCSAASPPERPLRALRACALIDTCLYAPEGEQFRCDGPYPARSDNDYAACYVARACPDCGADVDPDTGRCPSCGHKIGEK